LHAQFKAGLVETGHLLDAEDSMLGNQDTALAVASLESALTWNWHLKIDEIGLYRWYLNGDIGTNLRGTTQERAESALRRFVERALSGELHITQLGPRVMPSSEEQWPRVKLAATS
jgi:hypothetical protein